MNFLKALILSFSCIHLSQINNLQTIVSDSLNVLESQIENVQSTMQLEILKTQLEDFFQNIKNCLDY